MVILIRLIEFIKKRKHFFEFFLVGIITISIFLFAIKKQHEKSDEYEFTIFNSNTGENYLTNEVEMHEGWIEFISSTGEEIVLTNFGVRRNRTKQNKDFYFYSSGGIEQ